MAMTGMPSIAASSISDEAQAGLAAAGHADADGMGHEVPRIVENRRVEGPRRRGVVFAAKIEETELFKVLHT